MKTEQQYEEQRIECAIDTALLNADLLREQVAELEAALLAETQAKHEAVECLRRIVDGDESGELVELINGILSKHPEAADGVLAAAPAPVERVEQETVSYYERAHGEKSPTHGMSLDERIAHVGGRTNAAGYVEFGSVMAVSALIDHVLRDSPAPQPAAPALSRESIIDVLLSIGGQSEGVVADAIMRMAAPAPDVAGLVDRIVPRIDAGGPNPINPDVHCCEWTLHKERERIHSEFADALDSHQSGGAK